MSRLPGTNVRPRIDVRSCGFRVDRKTAFRPGCARLRAVLIGLALLLGAGAASAQGTTAQVTPVFLGALDTLSPVTASGVIPGPASVAVEDDAQALWVNPAAIDRSVPVGYFLSWSQQQLGNRPFAPRLGLGGVNLATLGFTTGPLGIGYQQVRPRVTSRVDRLAFALGGATRAPVSVGIRGMHESWRLPGGHPAAWRWDAGLLFRPARCLSVGAVAQDLNQDRLAPGDPVYHRSYTIGLGIRPLRVDKGSRLTLFADLSGRENETWKRLAVLATGVQVEPVPGLSLTGSYGDEVRRFGRHGTARVAVGVHGIQTTMAAALNFERGTQPGDGDRTKHARTIYAVHGSAARQRTLDRKPVLADMKISGAYGDEGQSGLALPIPFLGGSSDRSIRPILRQLDRAEKDPNVRGVMIHLSNVRMGGLASEVREGIARVRAKGKPVVARMDDVYGPTQYYLAAACDRIVLDPVGDITALGYRADLLYYGAMLDSAGFHFEKIAHGKFKSAGEQLTQSRPSEGQIEELNAVIDDMRETMLSDILKDRKMDRARFEDLADGRFIDPKTALEAGMVDSLGDKKAAERILNRMASLKNRTPVSIAGWFDREYSWADGPKVAVLWLDGSIEGGASRRGLFSGNTMGAETVANQLRALANRHDVKAVVLRIDSPGGSGQASDQMWRAVEELKKKHKTVVVSMSRVAASGGYYIACGANEIFADPMTITGSIGVLTLKADAAGFYEKHRIGVATFQRGRMMGLHSTAVPLSSDERANMQQMIDLFYDHFLDRVAAGRPLSKAQIDSVAQGRIWTGRQALRIKLIDWVGGLDAAKARAKQLAGLPPDARVENIYRPGASFFERAFMGAPEVFSRTGLWNLLRGADPDREPALAEAGTGARAQSGMIEALAPAALAGPDASALDLWILRHRLAERERAGGIPGGIAAPVLLRAENPALDGLIGSW